MSKRIFFLAISILFADVRASLAGTAMDSLAYATVARHATPERIYRVERLGGVIDLPASALTRAGFQLPRREGWGPVDSAGHGLIPWNEVTRVQIKANSFGAGAAIGGVLGLLGAAIVVGVGNDVASGLGGDGVDDHEAYGGIALAAVGGTVVGALVGSAFRHWKTIYFRFAGSLLEITLEDGTTLAAASVEPWPNGFVRMVGADGRVSFVDRRKVRKISDSSGSDLTKRVLKEWHRVP